MSPYRLYVRVVRRLFTRRLFSKLVVVFLLISMLNLSAPAAPQTIGLGVVKAWQDLRFAVLSSGIGTRLPSTLLALFTLRAGGNRHATIMEIRIHPGELQLKQGQEAVLSAIAYDPAGEPISGVTLSGVSRPSETSRGNAGWSTLCSRPGKPGTSSYARVPGACRLRFR
jgi:hypothetical protein